MQQVVKICLSLIIGQLSRNASELQHLATKVPVFSKPEEARVQPD